MTRRNPKADDPNRTPYVTIFVHGETYDRALAALARLEPYLSTRDLLADPAGADAVAARGRVRLHAQHATGVPADPSAVPRAERGTSGEAALTPVMSRAWAMPNADTFSIPPIKDFLRRWMRHPSVDPFARNSTLATYTNDLNPSTAAQSHMDAADFCAELAARDIAVECVLFDPPYSPRQITEVYQSIGRKVTTRDTQSARMKREVRDLLDDLIVPGGVVLSFGWNSVGFGITRGYTLAEVLIVCHGGDHNDTICIAEVKEAATAAEGDAR